MVEPIRVLVVEDEGIVAMDLAATLDRLGYRVAGTTGRGEEALTLAAKEAPDVALMDIRLAGKMDGIEAARLLRQQLGLPVIFLTAHTDDATLARARVAEPYGYIAKPFDETSLRTNLELVHYRRAAEQAREAAQHEAARARDAVLQNKMLQVVNETRTEFLSMASHELNTPLTPIRLNLDLLRGKLEPRLDEGERQLFDSLDRNFQRLAALVKGLLEAARLQSGKLRLEPAKVDLAEVVRPVAQEFQARADAGGYRFTVQAAPCEVMADGGRVAHVVTNLLDNAFKFTPAGGTVALTLHQSGDVASIDVADNGRGIEQKQLAVLFQPFSRSPDATAPGTGLGLYIGRSIAELHGGTLTCKSRGPGTGARFTFTLPVASRRPDA